MELPVFDGSIRKMISRFFAGVKWAQNNVDWSVVKDVSVFDMPGDLFVNGSFVCLENSRCLKPGSLANAFEVNLGKGK